MQGTEKNTVVQPPIQHKSRKEKLNEAQGQSFHLLVAKLLYLSKGTRQDIQTAVELICTRVKNPAIDDYKKLTSVI